MHILKKEHYIRDNIYRINRAIYDVYIKLTKIVYYIRDKKF